MLRRIASLSVLAICVSSLLAPSAWAQAARTTLSGTVFDQAKAVLPGVTVVATNEATGVMRETASGADGRYFMPTLEPGTYTLRVEIAGFQSQTRSGLVLQVGQEATVDFNLSVASVAETITVTGESPIVEVTTSRIGTNLTTQDIDGLPTSGRSQLMLMTLVPGLTPAFQPGTFEGGTFNANGRDTAGNLFLVDGGSNNDERGGGARGLQTRVSLDSMAEFQVLTHQYTAEFGGSSGVVVNAITRSGTNTFSGRGFYYWQDESLRAVDPFLKARGEKNPPSGEKIFGFSAGGPAVRNRAFWFVNLERDILDEAVQLNFPAAAAPLATDYSDVRSIKATNSFIRGDYHASSNHNFSFRWVRERTPTIGENQEEENQLREHVFIEGDMDHFSGGNWTAIFGNNATNEVRVNHVREDNLQGMRSFFDDDLNWVELGGRDQFDLGSANFHPDYRSGPNDRWGNARSRTTSVGDDFTFIKSGWRGSHTFKTGVLWQLLDHDPQIVGRPVNGVFTFQHNLPFNPANPFTYPSRFQILLGQVYFNFDDRRTNWYVQDKWQVNRNLTLNLGVRHDYQTFTPDTKDAFAPRLGFALDPTASGRTVIRGGIGKFYEYHLAAVRSNTLRLGPLSPSFTFDTGEDLSADRGVIPTHVCLQPAGSAGLANIGPACRALLADQRNRVNAGGFPNAEPYLEGDRRLGYLWSWSVGAQRELFRDLSVAVDYVGNRGYDNTGLIDINDCGDGATGRVTRCGVDRFDPSGTLIPAAARAANFARVLQYQTRDDFNSDFESLELSLVKRYSTRWSGRVSYTLARARDVNGLTSFNAAGADPNNKRYSNDLNPREDYARANFDNRHAVAGSVNVNPWRGLGIGATSRYYSGYPITEIVGTDVNADRDNFERPVRGVHDATRPIVSPVDSSGRAIRNGIDGENHMILDLRAQYVFDLPRNQTAGFFWEAYNATNRINYANPTGNRRSQNFLVPTVASDMARMQLGVRYTF
jgi:carboxypeptidase family protein/TonB-dependent receptor-like protein